MGKTGILPRRRAKSFEVNDPEGPVPSSKIYHAKLAGLLNVSTKLDVRCLLRRRAKKYDALQMQKLSVSQVRDDPL